MNNTFNSDITNFKATIVSDSIKDLQECADYLHQGNLVSFPTETVYGLGANALNVEACKKIFEYKGRPLSDPLIVHVTSKEMALSFVEIDDDTKEIFEFFIEKFWPGPLTIVLKSNSSLIDPILTANTGFIGIRYPNNEIAKKLINISQLPLAAPSANKFCHISPVNPHHVYEDFKEFPIKIIDGGVCKFSMESTVVKPIFAEKKIIVFRLGAISLKEIEEFLKGNQKYKEFSVEIFNKQSNKNDNIENFNESQEAPGQFIKHYSPFLNTYVIEDDELNVDSEIISTDNLNKAVLIDFNGKILKKFGQKFGYYKDLSLEGNESEVMKNLYDYLRWAELQDANVILICDLFLNMKENNHLATLVDRIKKASSSKRIRIKI